MLRITIILKLLSTVLLMSSAQAQHFEPSSWWHHMTDQNYVRNANNEQHRKDRGMLFIEDTQRWSSQNNAIPAHKGYKNDTTTLRVMTFNIRYHTDCLSNPSDEAIFEVIKTLNADIAILQEFELKSSPYNAYSKHELIKKFRDMGYLYGGQDTFGSNYTERNGVIGTVIFSKLPLSDVRIRRFAPTARWAENQSYIHAYVQLPNKQLSIYATHLIAESAPVLFKNAAKTRLAQVKQLHELIAQDQCENCLIAADCNAVRKQDLQDRVGDVLIWDLANKDYYDYGQRHHCSAALDFLTNNNYKNSFEYLDLPCPKVTTWSGIAVDNIFLSPSWNIPLKGSYVYFTSASDHYPIIMDIDIN